MTIRRTIVIPAILALSVAGSILAGSGAHVSAAPTPSSHVLAVSSTVTPLTWYHG
jgi:hypothetical protein